MSPQTQNFEELFNEAVRMDLGKWTDAIKVSSVPMPPPPPPVPAARVPKWIPTPARAVEPARKANFFRGVTDYALARLLQRTNSRLHSGWTGSRAEREHCAKWNLLPVNPERVV